MISCTGTNRTSATTLFPSPPRHHWAKANVDRERGSDANDGLDETLAKAWVAAGHGRVELQGTGEFVDPVPAIQDLWRQKNITI